MVYDFLSVKLLLFSISCFFLTLLLHVFFFFNGDYSGYVIKTALFRISLFLSHLTALFRISLFLSDLDAKIKIRKLFLGLNKVFFPKKKKKQTKKKKKKKKGTRLGADISLPHCLATGIGNLAVKVVTGPKSRGILLGMTL